jgi:hypothetical protein
LEAQVWLEIIVAVGAGMWVAVLLAVIALCRAAKRSDEAMDAALAREITAGADAETTRSPTTALSLQTLDLDQAATLLGVTPQILLAWEARYGFPTSSRSDRRYDQSEVLALRDSLRAGLSIASAVTQVLEKTNHRQAPTTARPVDHRDSGLAS